MYLRKGVTRLPKDDDGTVIFIWSYQEAVLTPEEYAVYLTDMEAPSIQSIMQQISDIQSEQEMQSINEEINTETIMQSISDLQADIAMIGL